MRKKTLNDAINKAIDGLDPAIVKEVLEVGYIESVRRRIARGELPSSRDPDAKLK